MPYAIAVVLASSPMIEVRAQEQMPRSGESAEQKWRTRKPRRSRAWS